MAIDSERYPMLLPSQATPCCHTQRRNNWRRLDDHGFWPLPFQQLPSPPTLYQIAQRDQPAPTQPALVHKFNPPTQLGGHRFGPTRVVIPDDEQQVLAYSHTLPA